MLLAMGEPIPQFDVVKKTGNMKFPNRALLESKVSAAYEVFANAQKKQNKDK